MQFLRIYVSTNPSPIIRREMQLRILNTYTCKKCLIHVVIKLVQKSVDTSCDPRKISLH